MKTKKFTTTQLAILGLMTAILLIMAYTPLGYLNIGPLAISFNVIPVAICAIVLGPMGGAIAGTIFGLTSFGQCLGIGGVSAMGAMLLSINPFLAFIQRFIPRLFDGICLGYILQSDEKENKRLCFLCSNRILFCIFKHFILYDSFSRAVWKYRVCKRLDGWKKHHYRMLYDGWSQCSLRNVFFNIDYWCGRSSTFKSTSASGRTKRET